jgi:hypothetical protein
MKTFNEVINALNFPVSLRANMAEDVNGWMVRGLGQQVLREDRNVFIADVSDGYGLVQHGASLAPVLQVLDGLDFILKAVKMDHDGKTVMVKAHSRQSWAIGKLPNGQVINDHGGLLKGTDLTDDRVVLVLEFSNSYDRTKALSLSLGAYRVICSNGMVASHPAFDTLNIERKVVHSINAVKVFDPSSLVNNVAALYAAMEKQAEAWRMMKQTRYAITALEALKEKVLLPIVGKRAVDAVAEAALHGKGQDGTLTAWALYNGLTEVLTEKAEKSKTPVAAETRFRNKNFEFLTALHAWENENQVLVTVNA